MDTIQFVQDNAQYIIPLVIAILTLASGYFAMYRPLADKIAALGKSAIDATSPSLPGGSNITPEEAKELWAETSAIWDEVEKLQGGGKPPGQIPVAAGAPSI